LRPRIAEAFGIMIVRLVWPLLVLLITAAGFSPNAAANPDSAPAWIDPGRRRTVVRYAVAFDRKGLSTTVLDFEILALGQKGADAFSQKVLSDNSYFGELTVSDLATVKAGAQVIAVDARAVRDQPASADISSPYFDETRKRIIAYSGVQAGDKVRRRAVYNDKRPRFAAQFEGFWIQSSDQPPEVVELTIDGPGVEAGADGRKGRRAQRRTIRLPEARARAAALGRDAARSLERADRQHLADEMIARDDPGGTGDYIFSDPR
jgi:Domain of Unknown Function with PDB structure (DUF3857)